MGRLSTYTPEIAAEILQRLETEPLNQICRDDHLPPESTVRRWATDDVDGFGAKYAHARSLLIEHWAEEITTISDDSTNDYMEIEDEKGRTKTVVDHENIQRAKLRVDSRKWLLSKLRPQVYGDRTALEHSGPGGNELTVVLRSVLDKPPDATR